MSLPKGLLVKAHIQAQAHLITQSIIKDPDYFEACQKPIDRYAGRQAQEFESELNAKLEHRLKTKGHLVEAVNNGTLKVVKAPKAKSSRHN